MPEVVNVRFRNRGKVYYFDPNGNAPEVGQTVVVETANGLELGECVGGAHMVEESSVVSPLRPVLRLANQEDMAVAARNRERELAAFPICEEKIAKHGLDMKLVDVECCFEGNKIRFFFTSDGRVDFRELVKDLASVFHARIDLRQIGVRDGAKLLGGLGICGRAFCCSTFLEDFQPVSIRMAKTQSLSLNPTKISGTCGRLMCCLKYEQEAYEYLLKTLPKTDTQVDTPRGKGVVTEINLLRRTAKVRLDDGSEVLPQSFPVDRLGYFQGGEYKTPLPEEPALPAEPVMAPLWDYMADGKQTFGERAAEQGRRDEHRREKKRGKGKERQPDAGKTAESKPGDGRNGEGKPRQPDKPRGDGKGKGAPRPPKPPRPPKAAPDAAAAAPRAEAAADKPLPEAPDKPDKKPGNRYRRYRRPGKKPGGSAGGE